MRNPSRAREKTKIQPPMTSMIDIIFLLLIFFLLTPKFQSNEGYLTTNLPKDTGPNVAKQDPLKERIKIELEEAGPQGKGVIITLNDTQGFGSNFISLRAALHQYRQSGLASDFPILIVPTFGVRHRWVVEAFDAAVTEYFVNIQFAVPGAEQW